MKDGQALRSYLGQNYRRKQAEFCEYTRQANKWDGER